MEQQQQWSNNPYASPQRQVPQTHSLATPQRDQPPPTATPAKYEAYNSRLSRAPSLSVSSPPESRQSYRMDYKDNDGDRLMEDADPYNKQKYAQSRPQSQRNSSHYLPTQAEDAATSSAARRYSPMNTSPTSPYVTSPNALGSSHYNSFTPQHQRQSSHQSPTRSNSYNTQSQGYYSSPTTSRHQQLPPLQSNMSPDSSYYPQSATAQLNAVFGREMRSPRNPAPSQTEREGKGPVPQFTKCNSMADLEPRVNSQPPFRRANPEGGFISPLQALTTQLPSTYRICNPTFQYESSRNPRRVLTKPSKGVKNDGYDNEDSDYILYVNDILGSEETNHKNRYLILDVLGQGTFGQVVKCQNLKTQEVVAVKVVKNKTAYFNQSMMEVSVLDLVSECVQRGIPSGSRSN